MNICYATDDNYIMQAAVSITSLLINNIQNKITIFILDNNISDINKEKLTKQVEKYGKDIVFCNVTEKLNTIIQADIYTYGGYGSYAAYARIFIRELLPPEIERILYIDCDTIINSDISELYNCDLKGKTIGAVRDITSSKYNPTIGLKESDIYFNSGVLLIDLKKWEEHEYLQKIIYHINNIRSQYQNADQDIINIVAHNDIYTLNPKYNHIVPIDLLGCKHLCYIYDKTEETYYRKDISIEATLNPAIIHFTYFFTGRPWFSNSMNGETDILWTEYLKKTPWQNYSKKKQKFRFVEKCQRIILGSKILPKWLISIIYKPLIYIRLSSQSGRI